MSYSIQQVGPSPALIEQVLVSIDYFDKEEISVLVDGVETSAWEWAAASENLINMVPPVLPGGIITIIRTTDLSELRHQYAGGARFDRATLDESFRQILHIAQESAERAISGDFFIDLDLHGNRVKNIADGTELGHAVTLRQLNAATGYDIPAQRALAEAARLGAEIAQGYAEGARDAAETARDQAVSAVTGALQRTQNLADLEDAVAARSNLGLTEAAISLVGTGANQLLRLDADGKIPVSVGMYTTQASLPYAKVRADCTLSDPYSTNYSTEYTDVTSNATDLVSITTAGTADSMTFSGPGMWLVIASGSRAYSGSVTPHISVTKNGEQQATANAAIISGIPGIDAEYHVSVTHAVQVAAGDVVRVFGHFLGYVTLIRLANL